MTCTPDPAKGRMICVFSCNPWESWIRQMVAENERDYRAYQLENDLQWEEDNGLHDYETEIEYIPVELLPEIHAFNN